ncbi:MAG TPA: ABC transporter ATP-binding protein [Methanomassiliicoccales archaeon]|jgi:molybdate transport system ATP-binding protein
MSVEIRVKKQLRDYVLDVDMMVKDEDIHVLFGRNGSGKTTILKMVAGLMQPDSGRIVINGSVLFDSEAGINLPVDQRGTGFMFQNYALFPHMTVLGNLAFGLKVKRLREKEIIETVRPYMEEYSLWELKDVRISNLSGGQRQQVALLRTLVLGPNIFLLDEPLNALDTGAQTTIRKEIRTLIRRTRTPCIIVTHDIGDAVELGDSACLLDQGRIVKRGKPSEAIASIGMTLPVSSLSWQTSEERPSIHGLSLPQTCSGQNGNDLEARK